MSWDVVIVGAGAAGLFFGCKLLEAFPAKKVLLLEKYNYIGGRVVTYRRRLANRDVQWEIGAGRIAFHHTLVRKEMDKYGLHWAPLQRGPPLWLESGEAPTHNPFTSLLPTKLAPLTTLPKEVLAQTTIGSLLRKLGSDEWVRTFPYWSEIHTMRADMALEGFLGGGEFAGGESFGVIAEGYQALTGAMAAEFEKHGGVVQRGVEVTDVHALADGTAKVLYKVDNHMGALLANTCILALHAEALQALPSVRSRIPALRHLQMEPLVRMYAVFPVHRGSSWFSGLPSMVTPGRVRYIIPINAEKGVIMISYTDGADARYWMAAQKEKGDAWVQEAVLSEVRALLPGHAIPDPYAFKIHPWFAGCTYWRPGDYDPKAMMHESLQLKGENPGVFVCGESVSLRQAWVEGALESVEALWGLEALQKRLQK
jgi:phytoene dehydrogenase-like protein